MTELGWRKNEKYNYEVTPSLSYPSFRLSVGRAEAKIVNSEEGRARRIENRYIIYCRILRKFPEDATSPHTDKSPSILPGAPINESICFNVN